MKFLIFFRESFFFFIDKISPFLSVWKLYHKSSKRVYFIRKFYNFSRYFCLISEFLDFNKILWYKGRDLSVDYVKLQESVKRETGENPVRCRRCKREKAKLFHCIITASGRSVGRDKKGMLREARRPAYFFFAATVHGLCKKQRHFMSACSKTDALSYGDSVFFYA